MRGTTNCADPHAAGDACGVPLLAAGEQALDYGLIDHVVASSAALPGRDNPVVEE